MLPERDLSCGRAPSRKRQSTGALQNAGAGRDRAPLFCHLLSAAQFVFSARAAEGWKMTICNELTDTLPLPAIEVALPLAEIYEG